MPHIANSRIYSSTSLYLVKMVEINNAKDVKKKYYTILNLRSKNNLLLFI